MPDKVKKRRIGGVGYARIPGFPEPARVKIVGRITEERSGITTVSYRVRTLNTPTSWYLTVFKIFDTKAEATR